MAISEDELTREELQAMTVAELREYAAERDIDLPSGATKGEIVTKIECADERPGEATQTDVDTPEDDDQDDESAEDEARREENEDLQARSVIDDPPASGGTLATTDERTMRISADNIDHAPKDQWVTHVTLGDGPEQNAQLAQLTAPVFLLWGDPEEAKLEAGDYIVRDGNGDIRPLKKKDLGDQFAKPEPELQSSQVQNDAALDVLQKAMQLWIERPGDAENIGRIYQMADDQGVDLRGAKDSDAAVKV